MMNDALKRALRPVKTRVRRNRFLRGAAAGLAAGLAAAVLLQAAAFFTPVPDRGLWAVAVAAAAALLTALGNALRPVKNETAAKAADACGLKERVITALEGGDEPIRQLQRSDACRALDSLDVKQIRPGSVKRSLLAALGCAAVLVTLLLVPNLQDPAAAAHKALTRTLEEGRKAIEQAAEEDEQRLPEEKKSELRKITEDLKRELGSSRDAADALVALDRAEQRLEQMNKQTAGDAAAGTETDAGETGEGSETQGQASGDAAAQAAAAQAGTAMAATDATAAQMKTLEALAALQGLVNPSLQSGKNGQGGQGAAGMTGQKGSQDGQGSGAGSGSGEKAGGGAGEGTTNLEQKGGGGGGPIQKGNRDPRYKEVEYETIYDPEHIDKAKQDQLTEQFRLGDEDSLQIETGPGKGNTSGDVPWSEALQDYADTESRAADRENLTTRERQWVNDYYRLLTEQQ